MLVVKKDLFIFFKRIGYLIDMRIKFMLVEIYE